MKEIYKDIPGYEGYQASNLGNIRSIDISLGYHKTELEAHKAYQNKLNNIIINF